MMKKLLMTASSWGHIRHFHLPYLHTFHEMGWQVHVGCANTPKSHPSVDCLLELPFTKKMSAPQNFGVTRDLRKKIQSEGYDLIICHTSLAAFFTRLAVLGLSHRPRVINMVHGYLFDDDTPLTKKAIYWGAEKVTAPVTDLILTMNQWDEDFARKHKLGKSVASVPGIGVDFAPYFSISSDPANRASLGIPQDAFVLIYPAEFSYRKNQQMLIRSMPHLPQNVYLLLPGRGDLLEECHVLAATLGVDNRVRFPGFVENMAEWYSVADVAVSASRSEGLPFNIMEAMACGLPVIASDVKGHHDLVTSSEIGLLYPYNDQHSFVDAVNQMMSQPQQWENTSQVRRAAVAPYQLSAVQNQVLEAYGIEPITSQTEIPIINI